jgi:hypothetical protein
MPKDIETPTTESQPDFDTETALADISADLFRQGGEGGDAGVKGADAGVDLAASDPSAAAADPPQQPAVEGKEPAAENTEAVQDTGAPKTWSKEALAEWATLTPRAQQEVLKREEDYFRGISQYKERAEIGDRYSQVVTPYAPILQAENIDPVQMFQSFAANHYILSRGTPEQKLELAANMISGYGIDFGQLINHMGDKVLEPVDPRVAALEREISELKNAHQSRQQQDLGAAQQHIDNEISSMAQSPDHPYFNELVEDIIKLFDAGQATNLQDAYDKAIYLNPTTRQKEIDRLTALKSTTAAAEEQARKDKLARSTADHLSLDPKSRNGTVPVGSIDDTLAETMAQIASRA